MHQLHLEKQVWALEAFANSAHVLTHSQTPQALMEGVCECITHQYPYAIAWVGIAENDPQKSVRVVGMSGQAKAYAQGIAVSWDEHQLSGQGPTGRAIRSDEPKVVNDTELDPSFEPWRERARAYGIRSSVGVPIHGDGKVLGALMVYATVPDAFTPPELRLFQSLANEIGFGLIALENQVKLKEEKRQAELAREKLLKSLEMVIGAMATTMELRDPYTSGHQRQVAKIAEAIAAEMGWDADSILGLKLAAMIHDMGKVSIPAELLTKPSKLTKLEYALIQEHANNGYLILKDIPFVWPIADMVRQHHERMDGSGYPQGLHGDQILPGARVLAVADTIESMSSHRPYRAALGLERAMQEVMSRAGKDLDAEVVNAAAKLFDQKALTRLLEQE